ncbi:MAG: hypothetical protein IJT79_06860 [Ruminococcus sp.]|nr:hypothetical protein [Ruminococcus sp.]
MKLIKRSLSILLTALMLVSMVSVGIISADAVTIVDSSMSYVNLDANNATDSANYDAKGIDFRDWSQRDHRWNYYALGSSSSANCNIGHAGCTVTSITKLMIEAGLATPTEIDPGRVIRYLDNNESFSGSNILWGGLEDFAANILGKHWWYRSANVFTSSAGANSDYSLLKADMTGSKTYTSALCGSNTMTDDRAAAMLDYMYRYSGTGYQQMIQEDTTGYTMANQRIRMSMMLQAGYHLVPNVHNSGTHWVAIDEVATRNSGTTTETVTYGGQTFTVETYNTFYVMNSWYGPSCDGTNSRDTFQHYLDARSDDTNQGKFVRIAAYSTNPCVMYSLSAEEKAKAAQKNAFSYAQTDNYKLWSNKDPRWACGITSYPTTTSKTKFASANTDSNPTAYGNTDNADSLIEMMGEWGQSIVALDKMLIQSGVKTSSYLPAKNNSLVPSSKEVYLSGNERGETGNLLGDLHNNSLIGATTGVISWDSLSTLDSTNILSSGTAYSSSTSVAPDSTAAKAMITNMRQNGYHYIINKVQGSTDDNAWYAVDETATLSASNTTNTIYGFASNADTSTNASTALSGSAYKVYYFTTPANIQVNFSSADENATVTATADGDAISSGDYVPIGSEVVITATPDADYELDKWTVNSIDDAETSNTYTFTASVDTTVVYTAKQKTIVYLDATGNDSGSSFTQSDDVWYAWTYENGAAEGVGEWIAGTTDAETGYLKFSGVNEKVNFVRMNKNASVVPSWDAKENQTANLTTEADKVYRITGWNDGQGYNNLAGSWNNLVSNTVYLYPNAVSTNNNYTPGANDVFIYAWTWNTATDGHWVTGTVQTNGLIKFEDVQTYVQFTRMNGAQTLPPSTFNGADGTYVWNRTVDITVNNTHDLYVLDGYQTIDGESKIKYYNNNSASEVTENDYRYWTKTDPRWNDVRLGGSSTSGDYTGNWMLAQGLAKLAIQAGLRDSSTWSVADYAADCYKTDGYMKDAAGVAANSGLTNYSFESDKTLTGSQINQLILDGYHLVLRVNVSGGGTEDVAVDEAKTLENNQIWVWRCTQTGSANSARLANIRTSETYSRVYYVKGGTTPGLTSDFDYRRWSRYDGRWKSMVMNPSSKTMDNNGATVVAAAKMLVQAGVFDDTHTPEDFCTYLKNNSGFDSDGNMYWGKLAAYSGGVFNTKDKTYLEFDTPINGVSDYHRIIGSGTRTVAAEKDTILEAIRQGYHMMLEVSNDTTDGSQTWLAVDEKMSLENNDVYIMDSTRSLKDNADKTLTQAGYTYLFRVVGYKGATTPIAEQVVENNETVSAVTLSAKTTDPAYLGTTSGTASYVYGTTGDAVLTLKSASTAQSYVYCIADTEAAAKAFATSTTVTSSGYSYSNGTVTINIADAFDTTTATEGTTKYIAVKAVNGSAESNVVTASMTYKTEQLTAGFASASVTINKGQTTSYSLTTDYSGASTAAVNPTLSYSTGTESRLSGTTFTGDTAGYYTITINQGSTTVTLGTGEGAKTVPANKLNFGITQFAITVNETETLVRFYPSEDALEFTYTAYIDKNGDKKLNTSDIYAATPATGNSRVFKGWYTHDGDPITADTTFDEDTALYAHWITVSDVAKDGMDGNILSGNYSGYGLMGVQLRAAGEDSNYVVGGVKQEMPEGLRFITSLSQSLLDSIDEIDGSVNGTNVEYGYLVTREDLARGYSNHYFGTENIPEDYELKYLGENVNGENTTGQKPYSAATDYRFVTNVNCTSSDYDSAAKENHREYDHKRYGGYRLYSMVITYSGANAETNKASNIIARPYLKYTDANGFERYRYDTYTGNSEVCGGCSVSYSQAESLADFVEGGDD